MNTPFVTVSEEQSVATEEMNRSIVQISTKGESTLHRTRKTGIVTQLQEFISKFKVELSSHREEACSLKSG